MTLPRVAPAAVKFPLNVTDAPVKLPVKFMSPVTFKLSSTVVVPLAESSVNPPDEVSISLSPVTPIRKLPLVKSEDVIAPVTAKLSVT